MSDDDAGLTREDLDQYVCAAPGCAATHPHMRVMGNCHVPTPLRVVYSQGLLLLDCAACGARVAVIAVASAADRVAADGATVYLVHALRSGSEAVFADQVQAEVYAMTGQYDITPLPVNQWPDQEAWAHGG